jgi:syntaxin 8
MATSNPSQLFLLADHIKLSLLERQRARSVNIAPNSQDPQISRSLDTLEAGIKALEKNPSSDADELDDLQTQLQALRDQFEGGGGDETGGGRADSILASPNDAALQRDFDAAQSRPGNSNSAVAGHRNVRFTDSPPSGKAAAAAATNRREELFPYRDDPDADLEAGVPDHGHLTNQQIHAYHASVMSEQDEQLDRLGHSIGRQRELSMAIGDELDEQMDMIDEVDQRVERHQGRLDGAARRLGKVARTARENWSMTTIVVLIVILVLLIVITK